MNYISPLWINEMLPDLEASFNESPTPLSLKYVGLIQTVDCCSPVFSGLQLRSQQIQVMSDLKFINTFNMERTLFLHILLMYTCVNVMFLKSFLG